MSNSVRRHALIALSLMTFLLFGAAAAEARDRDRDRVVKDALIGAAVGTLAQIVRGRDEGRQLLNGAIVGGALGAAVGASRDSDRRYDDRRGYDHRDRYDRSDRYDRHDRYDDSYDRSSYPYRSDAYYDARHRSSRDGEHRHHRRCN